MHQSTVSKINKKCSRKQKRAQHRLSRDINVSCSSSPTKYLVICNAGLVTGLSEDFLKQILQTFVSEFQLIMPPGKSYSFIEFTNDAEAEFVYNELHGRFKLPGEKNPLYLSFTQSVPELEKTFAEITIPGLEIIENFLTEREEIFLLNSIDWEDNENVLSELKHRKAKHFGYEFRYDTNSVDLNNPITPIPENYHFLWKLFEKHACFKYDYDQITINRYLPGQGIPPHIDTHSIFEDTILSLSLGSDCLMDFRRGSMKKSVLLPCRSLLVMSGESRYAWSHGICPRHNDVTETKSGTQVQKRAVRISFTFRKVRSGNCECRYPEYCDSNREENTIDDLNASGIENLYVHEVYDQISDHFDQTRYKPWPNVSRFLDEMKVGDLLLDVGCGNGKYLLGRSEVFKIGCDRSSGLLEICHKRNIEVLKSDCLSLPFRDNFFDAVISIAVIHHLSTRNRRIHAIEEILRVTKTGGRCLIYVWAKKQVKDSVESVYLKQSNKSERKFETQERELFGIKLPIHENRTEFTHSDNLVPWKRKGGGSFLRFYHVFENGELEELCLCLSVDIVKSYYDQGNWCVILRKRN